MEIKVENTDLILSVDDQEMEDIFEMNDGEYVDVFVDGSNIDLIFPQWDSYVDDSDILGSLNYDDAVRFNTLSIVHKGEIKHFNITNVDVNPALDEEEELMRFAKGDNLDQICMITYYFEN